MLAPWTESCDQPRQHIKKQRLYFANKGPSSQSYGFSRSHVWMQELDYKESWTLKNWYFWTVVLEKTLESPLDCKEIQPVHPNGNKSWIVIGMTDGETETLIVWPPDTKSQLIGKDLDAGKSEVAQSSLTLCDPMLGKIEGRRRRERQRMRRLGGITNSQSLLKLTSIESVMPSNRLILCRSLLLLCSIFPSIRVFSNESVLRIRWPKELGGLQSTGSCRVGHNWSNSVVQHTC